MSCRAGFAFSNCSSRRNIEISFAFFLIEIDLTFFSFPVPEQVLYVLDIKCVERSLANQNSNALVHLPRRLVAAIRKLKVFVLILWAMNEPHWM